ncbi:hypothetical protein DITRI_Ditri17bG0118700 [Diplodiscus trichospermus]
MSSSHGAHHHLHVALLPSSGMGHLLPFLRLAAYLIHQQCQVTLITTHPIVSIAESQLISRFLSAFPQVSEQKFTLLPLDPLTVNSNDPFVIQWETIRRSAHLLDPLFSSLSPPLSFIITDMTLMSSVIPVTTKLCLLNYILFTSSARMFSLFAYFPSIAASMSDYGSFQFGNEIRIPGLDSPIPVSSLPAALLDSSSLFARNFSFDSQSIRNVNGVLINSFEGLEKQSLGMLTGGEVMKGLPPFFPVGPFLPLDFEGQSSFSPLKWLECQKERSVVYVSFGSRTAMLKEQIRELGNGLVLSGYKFLWVVKSQVVDKEEEKEGLDELLGHQLMNNIKNKGMVIKEWVNQWEILSHKAVGGFISHCGWNSVVEAAWHGIPVMGWPQFADQMINAEVIEGGGWGLCTKSWGWGSDALVKGEEIGERIKELMGNEIFKLEATRISEEARHAVGVGGSCDNTFKRLFQNWK